MSTVKDPAAVAVATDRPMTERVLATPDALDRGGLAAIRAG